MHVISITQPGDADVLQLQERPLPEPVADQIRVRVHATALNRADVLQRRGSYPVPPGVPADVPGLEFAGEVDAVGPLVSTLAPGQRVFGLVGGGAYAEYLLTTERMAVPIPDGLDWIAAAAVPEVFMTAHDALRQASFVAGERVLIHAVGSGVGTAAVQLVRAMGGTSAGTARTPDKLERARELGLDLGLDAARWAAAPTAQDVAPDIVLDFVGGSYLQPNLEALAPLGRLVLIGMLGGSRAEVDLGLIQRKRLRVLGTLLRSRQLEEKLAVTRAFAKEVVPLLARGSVRPVVDEVFDLADAAAAHRAMEANQNFGKIVLRVP